MDLPLSKLLQPYLNDIARFPAIFPQRHNCTEKPYKTTDFLWKKQALQVLHFPEKCGILYTVEFKVSGEWAFERVHSLVYKTANAARLLKMR